MSIRQLLSNHTKLYLVAFGLLFVVGISFILVNTAFAKGSGLEVDKKERILSIYDRGEERIIVTDAGTIEEALKAAKIEIHSGQDVVEPALDTELVASKYQVNIYRARPVTIIDGSVRKRIVTAYQTPLQIAKSAKISLHEEDRVSLGSADDILLDGADVVMQINRAVAVNFKLYGKTSEVRTHAKTVGDFLKEKGIKLGKSDGLSVPKSQPIEPGMLINLWRDGKQTVTEEEEVDFPVERVYDANRSSTYREVKEPGSKGKRSVTYEIEMLGGEEVSRQEIASLMIEEPKKQIEIVGSKNNYSESLNSWLLALRTCETHGNYQAATGNGYYGAYQFLPATWNSIASKSGRPDLVGVLPSQASPADQDAMVVANARATAGLSTQHPGCYQKLGLSNKPPAQ